LSEITAEMLAEIESRAMAATHGPWCVEGRGCMHTDGTSDGYEVVIPEPPHRLHNPWWTRENAEFVANARSDVPTLVAAIHQLVAERDAAVAEVLRLREMAPPSGCCGFPGDAERTLFVAQAFDELREAAGPDAWGADPVAAIRRFRDAQG
jgi:hypothetical protein